MERIKTIATRDLTKSVKTGGLLPGGIFLCIKLEWSKTWYISIN